MPFLKVFAVSLLAACVWGAPQSTTTTSSTVPAVATTTCNGKAYVYEQLAGYGFIPGTSRDSYRDTLGGIGSSIAIDRNTWRKEGKVYKGLLYALPDRGWNTEGTLNYQNRLHRIEISFTPNETATVASPSGPNLQLQYLDTILFTDPIGTPTSGLDADFHGPYLTFPGISVDVPAAHYTGDGFGGNGTGGHRVSFDSEGLVLGHDGTFWVSDEYGPYIYQFSPLGRMIRAIRPPDALIPMRNGSESFSADSPPRYNPSAEPSPKNPDTGRNNNQGFEGLTTNPAGTRLYVLLQSATIQDGGSKKKNSRNTRFLIYDISQLKPVYLAEYVVALPRIAANDSSSDIARQSEIHYISETQFLVLSRDSGAGNGQKNTQSAYRNVDVFDISRATNVKGKADCSTCAVASTTGVLNSNVTAAEYCTWLNFNINSQLNRFGVHNGGATDAGLLNEKWESLALVPVNPTTGLYELGSPSGDQEYYLFSVTDNDFITQDGAMNFGRLPYADSSGYTLNNQVLVFKVKLPAGSQPLVG